MTNENQSLQDKLCAQKFVCLDKDLRVLYEIPCEPEDPIEDAISYAKKEDERIYSVVRKGYKLVEVELESKMVDK